ncbi:DinB family protein [Antarcticibacterium arcticum]|uniref:DinB family protein n=1 Tax=Antarcticibacterium arcticum TaxID=2585771 RepID=A0A5B8YGR8_9FLAO|nr:DinB family protein [Antarcticibacterium arcticum]QED37070.1 DinB family protein [Antarcticibacterium arcticum]
MKPEQLLIGDYPAYYQTYIDQLPQLELLTLLRSQREEMVNFLTNLDPVDLMWSYEAGKWTVAQVLPHMLDTERIFQYRALRIARKDKTPLAGFDQDAYVPASGANDRNLEDLIKEYNAIRESGICMFESFTKEMYKEKGISSGGDLSAAAAGFIIAGHEKHHLSLFKNKYNL